MPEDDATAPGRALTAVVVEPEKPEEPRWKQRRAAFGDVISPKLSADQAAMRLKSPKNRAASAKRQADMELALNYRAAGASERQIAKQLGCSIGKAHNLLADCYKAHTERIAKVVEEYKTVELRRLEHPVPKLAKLLNEGDFSVLGKWIQLSESRRKLLGCDAPTKFAPTTPDGNAPYDPLNADERAARVAELLALATDRAAAAFEAGRASHQEAPALPDSGGEGGAGDPDGRPDDE